MNEIRYLKDAMSFSAIPHSLPVLVLFYFLFLRLRLPLALISALASSRIATLDASIRSDPCARLRLLRRVVVEGQANAIEKSTLQVRGAFGLGMRSKCQNNDGDREK